MRRLSFQHYVDGVLGGDRTVLARAITVIESNLAADGALSARLLDSLKRFQKSKATGNIHPS